MYSMRVSYNRFSNLDELSKKRKGLEILQRILDEMEADLIYEQYVYIGQAWYKGKRSSY